MSAPRSMVFVDLDGTIIDFAGRVAQSTISAIRQARANGHLVVLSTGRTRVEIPNAVWDFGFDGAITAGGAHVEFGGVELEQHAIAGPTAAAMTAYFAAENWEYCLYSSNQVYPSAGMRAQFAAIASMAFGNGLPPVPEHATQISPLDHPLLGPPAATAAPAGASLIKALFLNDSPEAREKFAAQFAETLTVMPSSIPVLGAGSGEVTGIGITKGSAIDVLRARVGASIDRTIGIGDSHNDIEMLRACDIAVAVESAEASVLQASDFVTGAVLDHGIHAAFLRCELL